MTAYRNCNGITRRNALALGLGGFMGMGLAEGLLRRARASEEGAAPTAVAKGCILIWMDGGPTHFETFDPKPGAPAEIRGEFDPIRTNVSGIEIGECFPKIASMMDKFVAIRSVVGNDGGLIRRHVHGVVLAERAERGVDLPVPLWQVGQLEVPVRVGGGGPLEGDLVAVFAGEGDLRSVEPGPLIGRADPAWSAHNQGHLRDFRFPPRAAARCRRR